MKNLVRHIVVNFLIVAVFAVSVGIPVIHHFCMGTSEGITVFVKQRCCEGNEDMPMDCCRDDVVLQQMNDDGILSPSPAPFSLPVVILLHAETITQDADGALTVVAIADTSPPSPVNIPVLHHSLLI